MSRNDDGIVCGNVNNIVNTDAFVMARGSLQRPGVPYLVCLLQHLGFSIHGYKWYLSLYAVITTGHGMLIVNVTISAVHHSP